jgi:hypothetical protein
MRICAELGLLMYQNHIYEALKRDSQTPKAGGPGSRWPVEPQRYIYKAMAVPMLLYGSKTWTPPRVKGIRIRMKAQRLNIYVVQKCHDSGDFQTAGPVD